MGTQKTIRMCYEAPCPSGKYIIVVLAGRVKCFYTIFAKFFCDGQRVADVINTGYVCLGSVGAAFRVR